MWNLDSGTESDRTSRRELGRSSKNCRLYFTLQMPSQSPGCEDKQPSKRVIYDCIILKRNIPNARAQHKCTPSFPATFLLHSFICLYLEKKMRVKRKWGRIGIAYEDWVDLSGLEYMATYAGQRRRKIYAKRMYAWSRDNIRLDANSRR